MQVDAEVALSFLRDSKETRDRYGRYIEQLKSCFDHYRGNTGSQTNDFIHALRNPDFQERAKEIGKGILENDAGKIGLTTMLAIVGVFLGSIGIAGFGSAIGIPLAAVLGVVGLLFGNELDESGFVKRTINRFKGLFSNRKQGQPALLNPDPEDLAEDAADSAILLGLIGELADRCEHLEAEAAQFKQELVSSRSQLAENANQLAANTKRLRLLQWCVWILLVVTVSGFGWILLR
jgi:hypothetical protein